MSQIQLTQKQHMFLQLIRSEPGISSTSTILVGKLPNFTSDRLKPANEVWDILKSLKDRKFIREENGRLYPL